MKPAAKKNKSFGTLYHHSMGVTSTSVVLNHKPFSRKQKLRRNVGAGLTSVAMALYIYSYAPVTNREIPTEVQTASAQTQEEVIPTPEVKAPQEFSIEIPFLKTKSLIVPQVDPANEKEYSEALSEGVAQALGTGFPGENKRIFLFAHSTNSLLNVERYNAIFYDLGKVPNGEKIRLQYNGEVHTYEVYDRKIVSASEVGWLAPHDGEELILQTCYPPGTNWRRLLLFARPIES